jgi:2-hydroxy-3-keto-5-methylthiopentenyl-1-phosphate phosphatase
MLPVRSVLVDFDGTACLHDVAEHLLVRFGDPSWSSYDDAVERGDVGLRGAITAQAGLLEADTTGMLAYALEHCPMDPTFGPFVRWCGSHAVAVTLVSDGFGFYIEPLLRAHGIDGVAIITNGWRDPGSPRIVFDNGHGECIGCGTCKMRAVLEAPGPVAFVGEGQTDRYGALYADITFAKDVLVRSCERDGVPFVPWTDFDDVRRALEGADHLPGPVAPVRCPGWATGAAPAS